MLDLDAVCTSAQFAGVRELNDGSYIDEWGVLDKPSTEVIHHPAKGPITTLDDLKHYTPLDLQSPPRLGNLPQLVSRFKKKRAIILDTAQRSCGRRISMDSILLENLLVAPELAHEL